jgi:tRNA(adenine34) deaminase
MQESDESWMREALALAQRAETAGEVPVGAVLVKDGGRVAAGWNQSILARDPTAHAEIMALRAGAQALGNYRLTGTTLYVTLEPCGMCAGALVHARVGRLVYGAADPKAGAAGSVFNLVQADALNHRLEVTGGVLAEECGGLLKDFFSRRR